MSSLLGFLLLPLLCLPLFLKGNTELLEGSKNISAVANILLLRCKYVIHVYTRHCCCFSSGTIALSAVQFLSVMENQEGFSYRNAFH